MQTTFTFKLKDNFRAKIFHIFNVPLCAVPNRSRRRTSSCALRASSRRSRQLSGRLSATRPPSRSISSKNDCASSSEKRTEIIETITSTLQRYLCTLRHFRRDRISVWKSNFVDLRLIFRGEIEWCTIYRSHFSHLGFILIMVYMYITRVT